MITVFEDRQPTLEEAQKIVGGLVEMITLPRNSDKPMNQDIQVLVNEEGLLLNLPFNKEATIRFGTGIVGPAIVLEGEAKWT